jgi:hypothetical protein
MAHLIIAKDSITALRKLLYLTLRSGTSDGDRIELLSILVSINSAESPQRIEKFVHVYKKIAGTEFWDRAEQLYCKQKPLSWKVSYRGRLIGLDTESETDQLRCIIDSLAKAPGANTLCFSFYRPIDHIRARAIPASMPCPIAGDFKYRKGQLNLNVFFRTHDIYRLGFPDLFFMRALQNEILKEIQNVQPEQFIGSGLGELNLFFSRVFILKTHKGIAERLLTTIDKFLDIQGRKNERRC